MSELAGVIRAIWGVGDRRTVSRIEGRRQCSHCDRWHAYQVGLVDESLADVLLDSCEEAEAQVRKWLPDGLMYLGHRETEVEADATELAFTSKQAAIDWLLEAV